MEERKAVLIIPALDPSDKFIDLALTLGERFNDLIIVNDGSSEERAVVFARIKEVLGERCHLLIHEKNRGKGRALKTAMEYYQENLADKYLGVVTADSDGQHEVDDIVRVADTLNEDHEKVICVGARDLKSKVMPFRSKFGNTINAFLFRYLYGVKLSDTQSGLRAFSNDIIPWLINLKGERFEYEMNMLITAKSEGIKLCETPITTHYEKNHSSHFKTFSDSWRVTTTLFGGMLRFIAAALVAGVVDIGAFFLIDYIVIGNALPLSLSLLISTVASRTLSSVVNFLFNRFVTFKGKTGNGSVLKYYALWLVQMGLSYGFVFLFTYLFGGGEIFVKLVVDLLLSLFSYKIQQVWVFGKAEKNER